MEACGPTRAKRMSENFGEAFTHPDAANSKGTESALKRFLGENGSPLSGRTAEKRALFQEKSQQFFIEFFIGTIAHGQIDKRFFIDDTLFVGETLEAFFPVIAAHTARAESAERHLGSREMDNRVVDAAASETAPLQYAGNRAFVRGKEIQGKRRRTGVDLFNDFVHAFKSEHGHHGAENFFSHHFVRPGDAVQDGRLYL